MRYLFKYHLVVVCLSNACEMLKHILVLCAVLAVAFGALAHGPLKPKPDKFKDVAGCYIGDLDSVIPVGGSAPATKSCMEYRCNSDSITYVTCGVAVAHPPCKLVEHKAKPYPNCCPTVKC